MDDKVDIEDDDTRIRAVYFSKLPIDGTAEDISDTRIARRIYELLDVKEAYETKKKDKRLTALIWDKRKELGTINMRMLLNYSNRNEYEGTKASKKDIQRRLQLIKELKTLEAEDDDLTFTDTLRIANIYSQLVPTSDYFAYRIYRTISEDGWTLYAEEKVENPRLMLVMDNFDYKLAHKIFSRFIDIDIINLETEEHEKLEERSREEEEIEEEQKEKKSKKEKKTKK